MKRHLILTTLVFPVSLLTVWTISSCSNKQTVDEVVKDLNGSNWKGREYGLFYESDYVIDDNNHSVTYIHGSKYYGTNVVIPDYVWVHKQKYAVFLGTGCFKNNHFLSGSLEFNIHTTFIPEECFYNCDTLEDISFKNYIDSFEKKAFYNCTILRHIASDRIFMSRVHYFKDYCFFQTCLEKDFVFGNELKEIGSHAFSGVVGLNIVDLSHNFFCTKISDYAFCNCKALVKVIAPPNLKEIGDHTFLQCIILQSLVLPEQNMQIAIDDYAFYGCKEFTGFSRKCTLTKVGNYSFSGCSKFALDEDLLKNSSLNEIGTQAFAQCFNSIIYIPKNIKYINRFAFWQNKGVLGKLNIIDFSDYTATDDIPEICGSKVFSGAETTGEIYINTSADVTLWKDALNNKGFEIGPNAWQIFIKA